MRRLYVAMAADQAREAVRCLAGALAYAADAAWLLAAAVTDRGAVVVPVEHQPEYRINTWAAPGQEPKA